jgi:pyruvate kinase
MIWSLAEAGMNVARLNMSHGDHASHQKVIDLVKEYNAQTKDNVIALMVDTKVCISPFQSFYTMMDGYSCSQMAYLH